MKKFLKICFALLVLAAAASALAEIISYNYDSAGRLLDASYPNGKITTYQYDASGNLLRGANNVITDTDSDGMADSWETTYFGNLSRDGSGDFDGDGMSDLAEFLAGTLPNNASSALKITRVVSVTSVAVTIEWSSISNRVYSLQFKNSFNDAGWNDLPGAVTATSNTSTKIDTTVPGQPDRFYRVNLIQ